MGWLGVGEGMRHRYNRTQAAGSGDCWVKDVELGGPFGYEIERLTAEIKIPEPGAEAEGGGEGKWNKSQSRRAGYK